jgi:hypothetical protein
MQPARRALRIRFSGQPEEGFYAVRRYWRSIDGEPSCPIRSLHPGRLATVAEDDPFVVELRDGGPGVKVRR